MAPQRSYAHSPVRENPQRKKGTDRRRAVADRTVPEKDCRLRAIAEMIVTVSHEINNPLQIISGISEMLLQRDLPDDLRESLEMISRMSERIGETVKLLQNIKEAKATKYTDDVDMIDLEAQ